MYLVIRCPGCRSFTYVDHFQRFKLCPFCSEAINVGKAEAFLEVEDFSVADNIIRQLEDFLHHTKRKELTPEEVDLLRKRYAEWVRSREKTPAHWPLNT